MRGLSPGRARRRSQRGDRPRSRRPREPGAGKTRLATELARRTEAEFTDGAVFVELAPVRDPALVPVQIAGALGLQDSRGTALLDHLVANLSGREVLLVLDNLELRGPAGRTYGWGRYR